MAFTRSPAAETARADGVSDDSLRIRGIFTSILPGTERKHSLKLNLHPHVGDLLNREHLRTDLGLSYALSSRFAIGAETRVYMGHGLENVGLFKDWGLADYRFQAKVRLGDPVLRGWDTGLAMAYQRPLGTPAYDVTDGLEHRELFLTFARRLENMPDVRVFWGFGADLIHDTGIPSRWEKNDLRDRFSTFSGGWVIDRGAMHYTFESSFSTTRLLGSTNEDVFTVRPGFIWEIPPRFTLHSRGQWLLGLALPVTFGPDGTEVGVAAKVRLNFDFKRLIGRGSKKQ